MAPERPKGVRTHPRMTKNPGPGRPKTAICDFVKTLENHCFYCALGTLGRPRSDVLATKKAIVAPTAQRTPEKGENVGQVVPKVTQRSQNGVREGSEC